MVLYLETFFWLHNNYKGKKGDLSVAGQHLIRLLGLYQCISVHWNGIDLRWLCWGIVDDLLNSRDQHFAFFHPTWNLKFNFLNCTITVSTRTCPQTSILPQAPTANPRHVHLDDCHLPVLHPGISTTCPTTRTTTTTATRDVMWVQSHFFFFFLWGSINDYYTDILWMVNYNKASMTSNESTKRARDALHSNTLRNT